MSAVSKLVQAQRLSGPTPKTSAIGITSSQSSTETTVYGTATRASRLHAVRLSELVSLSPRTIASRNSSVIPNSLVAVAVAAGCIRVAARLIAASTAEVTASVRAGRVVERSGSAWSGRFASVSIAAARVS